MRDVCKREDEPYPIPTFWLKQMNTTHCEALRRVGEEDRKFKVGYCQPYQTPESPEEHTQAT